MVEEIKEELEETYKLLTINVEYVKIKTYKIMFKTKIINRGINANIKVEFNYNWNDNSTFSANIEQIKYYIKNNIIKIFLKEV